MRNLSRFVLLLFWVASGHAQSADSATFHINSHRLQGTLEKLSEFGRNPEGGVTRLGFSETDLAAREYVTGLMKQAGLEVRIDPAGNIFGLRAGSKKLPILLFGSHIDSVLHGGNFDGDVGSMGAIEVMQALKDGGVKTRHPLEAVIWANEEGNHFGIGTLGSGVAAGSLGPEILERKDDGGLTLADWLRRYRQPLCPVVRNSQFSCATSTLQRLIACGSTFGRDSERWMKRKESKPAAPCWITRNPPAQTQVCKPPSASQRSRSV
jgi:hypothetical protein